MLRGAKVAISSGFRAGIRASAVTTPHMLPSACSRASVRAVSPIATRLATRPVARLYGSVNSSRLGEEAARVIEYAEVKKLVEHPDPNVVIVDVREPSEFEAGHIPHAVNIPFKSMPGALGLEAAEFESTLGFPKPDPKKTLLFYCLGGVRSTVSEQIASTYGYSHRMNYKGSYDDWSKQEAKQA